MNASNKIDAARIELMLAEVSRFGGAECDFHDF
jgi:hypothetical protein